MINQGEKELAVLEELARKGEINNLKAAKDTNGNIIGLPIGELDDRIKKMAAACMPGEPKWHDAAWIDMAICRMNIVNNMIESARVPEDLALSFMHHPDPEVQRNIDRYAQAFMYAYLSGIYKPKWANACLLVDVIGGVEAPK
ncbi:MAG: hypothetical protein K6U74_01110 [Firmicutes bacterium]|nr:hypothetical protein [Bacillota bacterium]